ncbi:hypothetical protein SCALM49S_03861 [Streptomyces californicus]
MAPRAGKSTGIAVPRVLRARGCVLLTSNKSDVYTVTRAERERAGQVWTFDPQGIAHTPRALWWDMLADARDIEGARRLAGHFVGAVNDDASKRDFWISAAQILRPSSTPPPGAAGRWTRSSAGSPTRPTAPRSTCCATPACTPSPSSSAAPSRAGSRRGTASTRRPASA